MKIESSQFSFFFIKTALVKCPAAGKIKSYYLIRKNVPISGHSIETLTPFHVNLVFVKIKVE